jgi:mono/diheme cytochrome c family protein
MRMSDFTRSHSMRAGAAASLALLIAACNATPPAPTAEERVARGKYLVSIMGCGDCHTPGSFRGMPDQTKALAGSDVSFFVPGMGYFYPANLTPDATGLGQWSEAQIVAAIRTGMRPDGRMLAPAMPWMGFANLTDEDANSIALYLKSLMPIANQVPAPTAADQMPPGPSMAVVAPPDLRPIGAPPPPPPPVPPPPARGGRGRGR